MENPDLIPSAELAYLGDSVIEILVRERLVLTPSPQASSKRSLAFVTAVAQSKALDNIIPMFTEEESDVFRRGRNCVHSGIPKSASAAENTLITLFKLFTSTIQGIKIFRLLFPPPEKFFQKNT